MCLVEREGWGWGSRIFLMRRDCWWWRRVYGGDGRGR